jgi:hypothetical protein
LAPERGGATGGVGGFGSVGSGSGVPIPTPGGNGGGGAETSTGGGGGSVRLGGDGGSSVRLGGGGGGTGGSTSIGGEERAVVSSGRDTGGTEVRSMPGVVVVRLAPESGGVLTAGRDGTGVVSLRPGAVPPPDIPEVGGVVLAGVFQDGGGGEPEPAGAGHDFPPPQHLSFGLHPTKAAASTQSPARPIKGFLPIEDPLSLRVHPRRGQARPPQLEGDV